MSDTKHFLELLIANAPGWIGMVILAWLFWQYIKRDDDND